MHAPCGDGQMTWRLRNAGGPLVLLHGGAGSCAIQDRPRAVLQAARPGSAFRVAPNAGRRVAYEAPEAFASVLRTVLPPIHHVMERQHAEA